MKKLIILNAVVAIIFGSVSFTELHKDQGNITASIKRGKEIYNQYCLACHQTDGAGVPRMNPPLIRTKWVMGDKDDLIKIVLKGMNEEIEVDGEMYHNTMPPHNFLSDQQVADVLTFVRNNFTNKASAVTVAEVKAVRAKAR